MTTTSGGNGGAIFHYVDESVVGINELQFEVQRSAFIQNDCNNHGAAIWAGIVGQGIIENCTFYRDSVHSTAGGLGGAVNVHTVADYQGGWLIKQNTFAENYAGLFGGAFFGGHESIITWQNNILYNNSNSNINPWVGHNVNRTMDISLGANIQWPQYRPNGSEDNKVTPNVIFQDPLLAAQPLYNGGPTPTMALDQNSPAIGIGTGCSTTDQRLTVRFNPCDLGAFEYGALSLPDSLHVTGIIQTTQTYQANQIITSDAVIKNIADIIFLSGLNVILFPGFEVEPGGSFSIE